MATAQSQQQENQSICLKLVMVGEAGVGKTSIIQRYVHDEFSQKYILTFGMDFTLKLVTRDNKTIKIQLWDIGGKERYRSISKHYYRDANAAFVAFDIALWNNAATREAQMAHVKNWKDDLEKKGTKEGIPVILLANKVDLMDLNQSNEEMNKFCSDNGFTTWLAVSAKDNIRINEAFDLVLDHVLSSNQASEEKRSGIIIDPKSPPKSLKSDNTEKPPCAF